jgi:hypothetical protein
MVDRWSKCPIQKLCQIFKSTFRQSFIISEVPNYFIRFIFTPEYLEIDLEKENRFFLCGPLSAALAQSREATSPLPFPLSPVAAKWAPCARVAHRLETLSLRGPTCQELPPPNLPSPTTRVLAR